MEPTVRTNKLYQFKRYFQFFFLFGQDIKNMPNKRILSYIPAIVSLILVVFSESRLIAKDFSGIEAEHGIMLHSLMIVNMLPSLVAAVEIFRMSKGTQYFAKIFNIIIDGLKSKKSVKIEWKNVQKKIWSKILIIIVWYFLVIFFRFASRSPLYGRRYEIWSSILLFYRTASVFHTIFYVELITFLITTVTSDVEAQRQILAKKVFFDLKCVICIMKVVKLQHFQIWHCCQAINEHFGIIIIAIMIDSLFTVTVYGYFAFFFWDNDENLIVTIRKYYAFRYNL